MASQEMNGQPPATRLTENASSDLLSAAASKIKSKLDRRIPVVQRIQVLWAAAKAARKFGAADVVAREFIELANTTGLTHDLGRYGREDVEHVVSWAVRGLNPFRTGALQ